MTSRWWSRKGCNHRITRRNSRSKIHQPAFGAVEKTAVDSLRRQPLVARHVWVRHRRAGVGVVRIDRRLACPADDGRKIIRARHGGIEHGVGVGEVLRNTTAGYEDIAHRDGIKRVRSVKWKYRAGARWIKS